MGYGNPLRSDDSLGWQVAVELFRTNSRPDVEVLPCHQLTPELAAPISRSELVIIIDCAREGTPGEFHCEELRGQSGPASFTHDLSPVALRDLASQLFGCCPRTFLLSVCGESFETGESMSDGVRSRIPELKARVRDLVAECLQGSAALSR